MHQQCFAKVGVGGWGLVKWGGLRWCPTLGKFSYGKNRLKEHLLEVPTHNKLNKYHAILEYEIRIFFLEPREKVAFDINTYKENQPAMIVNSVEISIKSSLLVYTYIFRIIFIVIRTSVKAQSSIFMEIVLYKYQLLLLFLLLNYSLQWLI